METAISFDHKGKIIYLSTDRRAYISKIKKWKQQFPDLVNIIVENSDGSLYVSVPGDWFRFIVPSRKAKKSLEEKI